MPLRALKTTLRNAGATLRDYRHATPGDEAMIGRILAQAATLRHFQRYRDVIREAAPEAAVGAASNRVWQLWWQGSNDAPPIVKSCLESVRTHLGNHETVVLDERNLADHIVLPGHIMDRKKRGQMSNVNFSDVLRAYLLAEHGGTWLDATVYLTAPPPAPFLQRPLFAFSTTPAALMGAGHVLGSSWFLHAEKGSVLLTAVKDLLTEFWRRESRCPHPYYFHLMFALAVRESTACAQLWRSVPFYSNVPPHALQFELFHPFDEARFQEIKQMTAVHKLTYYGDDEFQPEKRGTFYSRITSGASSSP